jgi:hypothetical protein
MYNFKRLVKKYGKIKPLYKTVTDGHYDYTQGGIWVEGSVDWIEFDGAVVPLGEDVVKDNHDYTIEDKQLYAYASLDINSKVKHKDIIYTVMTRADYTDFDEGLNAYILKRGDVNV